MHDEEENEKEKSRREAEEKARREAAEAARRAAEEKGRREAEEIARLAAEELAREREEHLSPSFHRPQSADTSDGLAEDSWMTSDAIGCTVEESDPTIDALDAILAAIRGGPFGQPPLPTGNTGSPLPSRAEFLLTQEWVDAAAAATPAHALGCSRPSSARRAPLEPHPETPPVPAAVALGAVAGAAEAEHDDEAAADSPGALSVVLHPDESPPLSPVATRRGSAGPPNAWGIGHSSAMRGRTPSGLRPMSVEVTLRAGLNPPSVAASESWSPAPPRTR
jgi:hypothetical protein